MITKKTLRICISTELQGQFLCLDNYSIGWAFCPLTGYFTLPVDNNVMGHTATFLKGANPAACQTEKNTCINQIFSGKLNKICFLLKCKKSHKIKVFALFSATKKTLWVCISTDLQGQFLRWDT